MQILRQLYKISYFTAVQPICLKHHYIDIILLFFCST